MPQHTRCQHGQKMSLFCLSDSCTEPMAGGCPACFDLGHRHSHKTIITEQRLQELHDMMQIDPKYKYKYYPLREALSNFFIIIKTQLNNSIDAVSRAITNSISHPYLLKHGQLPIFKKIKEKQYHKLTISEIKAFQSFVTHTNKQEMQNYQLKTYLEKTQQISKAIQKIHVAFGMYEEAVKNFDSSFTMEMAYLEKILDYCSGIREYEEDKLGRKTLEGQDEPALGKRTKDRKVSIDFKNGPEFAKFHSSFQCSEQQPEKNRAESPAATRKLAEEDNENALIKNSKNMATVFYTPQKKSENEEDIETKSEKKKKKPNTLKLEHSKSRTIRKPGSEHTENSQHMHQLEGTAETQEIHMIAQKMLPKPEEKPKSYCEGVDVLEKTVKIHVPEYEASEQASSPIFKKRKNRKENEESELNGFRLYEIAEEAEKSGRLANLKEILNEEEETAEIYEDQAANLPPGEAQSLSLFIESLPLPANEAIPLLQQSLQLARNNLSAAEYLSYLYLEVHKPKQCLDLCNMTLEYIAGAPESKQLSVHINNNKAAALNMLGRYSESISILEKCLEHKSRDIYFKNLADAYFSISIYEKATINYQKAILINPTMDEAFYNLALCLFMQKNYREAKRNVQRAITLSPTSQEYQKLSELIMTKASF